MPGSLHLLFPLFSSLLFVVGAMFAKRAALRGASPYTSTVLSNLCLALFWGLFGALRAGSVSSEAWGAAAAIALAFVIGQLCTYLAFQYGDVSLATPIFGVKIIIVALLSSLLAEKAVEPRIWVASVLAAVGVGVVQASGKVARHARASARRVALTILLAVLAATSLSLFDIGLQLCGKRYGAEPFLVTMFVLTGVFSLGLLPWADRPARVREIGAVGPLAGAALLMATQAVSISYSLGQYGDATRINIVYALRGFWSVLLAWGLSRLAASPDGAHSNRTMLLRLLGAMLLMVSVVIALL